MSKTEKYQLMAFGFMSAALILRMVWTYGSHYRLLFCILFWVSSFSFGILWATALTSQPYQRIWRGAMLIGLCLNALVTIMNGGYMPNIGAITPPHDIWITATPKHYFLPLCDRFAGFSLGDFCLDAAMLLGIVLWAIYRKRGQGSGILVSQTRAETLQPKSCIVEINGMPRLAKTR